MLYLVIFTLSNTTMDIYEIKSIYLYNFWVKQPYNNYF